MAARMQRQRSIGRDGAGAEHRAAARFAAGDHRAAAKICRQALKRAPLAADLWHLLAAAELAEGHVAPARRAVDKACALVPASCDYANTRALVLERAGALVEAEHLWRGLIDDDPNHADAGYNLARLYCRHGDAQGAVALLERVVACRPQWAAAWLNLGEARFECGDEGGAEQAYAEACRAQPPGGRGL